MIRLLLADDEDLLRDALASLLGLEHDMTVVAQAGDGEEAVALAAEHEPDLVVLDLEMPKLDGVEGACPLSERELEVLRLVREGLSASAIAAAAHLAPGTVRNSHSAAMAKLGAPTRADAARTAWEEGWI